MILTVCPRCRNLSIRETGLCLFCGAYLKGRGRRVAQNDATSPRSVPTKAALAQRALSVFSLLLATSVVSVALAMPPAGQPVEANGAILPPAPAEQSGKADLSELFGTVNGDYNVSLALSEVTSDHQDTLDAAEDIRGEIYSGLLTLQVDGSGAGTISIQQIFFSPEAITVTAFTDPDGNISQNTLYGFATRGEMKLSVVCVCSGDAVSGFIWLDSETTHIEFLYYS